MQRVFFSPFACFFPSPDPQDVGLAMLGTPGVYRTNYCCRKEWILKHGLEKVHGSGISQDPLSVMVTPGWGLNAKTTDSALGVPRPWDKDKGKLIFSAPRTSPSWVLLVVSLISLPST